MFNRSNDNKQVKICFILPRPLLPLSGGSYTCFRQLITLKKRGFEIALICQRGKTNISKDRSVISDLRGINILDHLPKFGSGLFGHLSSLVLSWPYILIGILREKPDIIHVHNPTDIIPMVGAIVNWVFKIPFVYQINDPGPESITSHMGLPSFLKKPYLLFAKVSEKIVLSRSDGVILLNKSSTAKFIKSRNIDRQKSITYYYHTVFKKDEEVCASNSVPQDYILYVGSLTTPFLGLEDLIVSFFPIWQVHRTRLFIVGDGPLKERLKEIVRKMNGEEYIKILGYIKPDITQSYIRNAKCCVIPYLKTELTEIATPTKTFEFMSKGKAIVYPDLPGLIEVLGTKNPGMYRSSIPGGAIDVIDKLLSNDELRGKTEAHNKRLFVRYDYDRELDKIIDLYEEVHLKTKQRK